MSKPQLLMLHGALATQRQFDSVISALQNGEKHYCLTFEGHGEYGPTDRPYRIGNFAENVLHYIEEKEMDQVDLFGYSMGGYVALYLARKAPEKIRRIATLGTVLQWNKDIAAREAAFLDPKKIEEKVPDFSRKLDQLHSFGWKEVVDKTREMILHLGNYPLLGAEDWKAIDQPVRIHIGDRDQTAELRPTAEVYYQLDNGELTVLPGTPHSIEKTNLPLLSESLISFFGKK